MRRGLLRHLRRYRCVARAADLRRGEDGQTLLLGIGVIAVVAGLLLVVAGATAVYLDLKTLTSLADSAAAAAVAGVDEDGYFEGRGRARGGAVRSGGPARPPGVGAGASGIQSRRHHRDRHAHRRITASLPAVGCDPGPGLHHHRDWFGAGIDCSVSAREHGRVFVGIYRYFWVFLNS